MSSGKEHWTKNAWVVTILGGSISGLFGSIAFDFYSKTPILTTIKYLANYDIKAWVYGLTIGLVLALNRYLKSKPKLIPMIDEQGELTDAGIQEVDMQMEEHLQKQNIILDYTAERFKSNIWQWKWVYNTLLKRYEVKDASLVCQTEGCNNIPLKPIGFVAEFAIWEYKCQICGTGYASFEEDQDIARQIEEKFETILRPHNHQNLP